MAGGGQATQAGLDDSQGIAIDSAGDIYIANYIQNVVQKVTASTGIITTMAGNGIAGYSGDRGPATSAELLRPTGIAVDNHGNIYINDANNGRVREETTFPLP